MALLAEARNRLAPKPEAEDIEVLFRMPLIQEIRDEGDVAARLRDAVAEENHPLPRKIPRSRGRLGTVRPCGEQCGEQAAEKDGHHASNPVWPGRQAQGFSCKLDKGVRGSPASTRLAAVSSIAMRRSPSSE